MTLELLTEEKVIVTMLWVFNADQNRSLNIMREVVGDSYVSRIVNSGHSLCPVRYSNPFVRIV